MVNNITVTISFQELPFTLSFIHWAGFTVIDCLQFSLRYTEPVLPLLTAFSLIHTGTPLVIWWSRVMLGLKLMGVHISSSQSLVVLPRQKSFLLSPESGSLKYKKIKCAFCVKSLFFKTVFCLYCYRFTWFMLSPVSIVTGPQILTWNCGSSWG